jgi:hypothetical protein
MKWEQTWGANTTRRDNLRDLKIPTRRSMMHLPENKSIQTVPNNKIMKSRHQRGCKPNAIRRVPGRTAVGGLNGAAEMGSTAAKLSLFVEMCSSNSHSSTVCMLCRHMLTCFTRSAKARISSIDMK